MGASADDSHVNNYQESDHFALWEEELSRQVPQSRFRRFIKSVNVGLGYVALYAGTPLGYVGFWHFFNYMNRGGR